MATSILTSGEDGRRRREAAPAIILSLVLHAVLILAIGLLVPKTRYYIEGRQPPVTVVLLPALDQIQHERAQPVTAASSAAPKAGRSAPPLALSHIHLARPNVAGAPPSPLAAEPAGEASSGKPGAGAAPGPLPYDEAGKGVRAFLRGTVGCESAEAVHLTAEERARCAERFAQDARNGQGFSGIDPAKRGAFSAQAAADEHKRSLRDNLGSAPLIVPCQGQGSNMGVGCLPDSAMGHVKIP